VGVWLGQTVNVTFDLGSSYRAPAASANMWGNGTQIFGVQGTENPITVSGRSMNFTAVKLEIGDVATPFEPESAAEALSNCMRYYQRYSNLSVSGWRGVVDTIAFTLYSSVNFPMMRAAPTVVVTQGSIANTNAGAATLVTGSVSNNALQVQAAAGIASPSVCRSNYNLTLTA
jgi:hypothetical protein